MYESPIKIFESTIDSFSKAIIKQRDDAVFAEIQSSFGADVDKAELLRALKYDRDQYDKGYADGERDAMASIVRCKECRHCTPDENIIGAYGYCYHFGCYAHDPMVEADDFCSYGERR